MKRNIIAIALFTVLAGSTSCKKILETEPTDFLTPVNYFQTETQIDAYLASVYDPLNDGTGWYREQFRTNLSEGTDESYNTSNTATPYPAHYSAGSSDVNITAFWTSLYRGIDRANTLLENLDKAPLSDAKRRHVLGETKFLRAFYFFNATQWFGDVPLKLTSTKSPADAQIAFTPTKEVYDFVIKEMTEAEALLVDQKITSLGYSERVTYTTVQGILARVCLFAAGYPVNDTKRYAEALAWANKVKASNEHALNQDYRQIFINQSADKYDVKESMWEVGFYMNPSNAALRELIGALIGVNVATNAWGRIQAQTRTTAILYRAYESNYDPTNKQDLSPDLRRDWNVAPYTLTLPAGADITTVPTITPVAWNSWWLRYPGKWRRQYEVVTPRDPNNSPQNFPLLRYADVLLMLAEAENEVNGPTGVAYEAINLVRRRAYGQGNRVTSITVTNGGSGYTSAPTVTVSPSISGVGAGYDAALATATISGGKVTSINVVSSVGFYTSPPTVTITGGGGTGATATAVTTAINPAAADLTTGLSKDAFRKIIQDERLRELNGECLRRQDLKRWNILVQTVQQRADLANNGSAERFPDGTQKIPPVTLATDKATAVVDATNISDRYIYLPIPLSEITNNRLAKQNAGF
jgi:starch-binding outer membrane protein, SusD/RagB family